MCWSWFYFFLGSSIREILKLYFQLLILQIDFDLVPKPVERRGSGESRGAELRNVGYAVSPQVWSGKDTARIDSRTLVWGSPRTGGRDGHPADAGNLQVSGLGRGRLTAGTAHCYICSGAGGGS